MLRGLRRAIAVSLLLLFVASAAHAQSMSYSGTWQFRKVPIPTTAGGLRLVLADLSPDSEYSIGIEAKDVSQGTLVVGAAVVDASGPMRHLKSIDNWPSGQVVVTDSTIRILGNGNGNALVV